MTKVKQTTFQIIERIFNAHSVAVIGASTNPRKYGHMTLKSLIKGGYQGRIYPVNPKGGEILGLKVYTSLKNLPETPDVAIILIPVDFVPAVLREAAEIGIPGAIITSAGFSEVGRDDLQKEISAVSKECNIRIVGPNIEGFIYMPNKLHAQFFPIIENCGPLATITQSGSITNGLIGWSNDEGVGVSACINLGNQVDICESDFLEFLATDENTKAIIMHLEGVKDGRTFVQSLNRIAHRKPLVILKAGSSAAGQESVASHTASLAGSHEVFKAVCRQFGVIPVPDIQSLYDYGKSLALMPIPKGNRVLVISSSGGLGVLTVDQAESHGISIPKLPMELVDELRALDFANPLGSMTNPIDLATMWAEEFEKTALIADKYDVADVFLFNFGDPIAGAGDMLIRLSEKIKASIIVSYMGGEDEQKRDLPKLQSVGIPMLSTPEPAIRSIAAAVGFDRFKHANKNRERIDYRLPTNNNLSDKATFISEPDAAAYLKQYQIPYPECGVACNADEAVDLAEKLGYPVVLKVVSVDIPHKSDVGGVVVNLNPSDEVREGVQNIMQLAKKIDSMPLIEGVLVCSQAAEGVEVIIGALDDAVFGPTIMFGLGGVFTEVLKDVSFRVAPLRRDDAQEMIKEIKGYPIIRGTRGEPGVDINKLIDLLLKVSKMVIECREIKELDLNPVRVYKNDLIVLDARIMKKESV